MKFLPKLFTPSLTMVEYLLGTILLIYPVLLFLVRGGMSASLVLARNHFIAPKNGAARMGMCLILGFFVFGLTVETFDLKMTAAFYSMTVAVLLASATHKPGLNESNLTATPST